MPWTCPALLRLRIQLPPSAVRVVRPVSCSAVAIWQAWGPKGDSGKLSDVRREPVRPPPSSVNPVTGLGLGFWNHPEQSPVVPRRLPARPTVSTKKSNSFIPATHKNTHNTEHSKVLHTSVKKPPMYGYRARPTDRLTATCRAYHRLGGGTGTGRGGGGGGAHTRARPSVSRSVGCGPFQPANDGSVLSAEC
ncbi:hypothetical protein BO71DRAFT_438393 [Aspergillus ellipticus CBS 707.79]|uniref:Uncharacterized protein n=1 Tax=Aspergillus ellipticus CBS 707.79 TaxID=1448320 RepID=A0A319EB44_9EURO|nr:hypothetical protein BO71DRAFT_438393 [Aspergillus ellipticus CBS 707.79]